MDKRKSRSSTRLVRQNGQFIIYYKPKNCQFEEEMMKLTMVNGDSVDVPLKPVDSLQSMTSLSSEDVAMWSRKRKGAEVPLAERIERKWFLRSGDEEEASEDDDDDKLLEILKKMENLNAKVRKQFEIPHDVGSRGADRRTSSTSSSRSSRTSRNGRSSRRSSSSSNSSVLTAKAYNWRGEPIIFSKGPKSPEKTSEKKEEDVKPPTRITSPTRFPGAKSSSDRKKERRLLQEIVAEKFHNSAEYSSKKSKRIPSE